MTEPVVFPTEGGCDCRAVRYRMESAPLVVVLLEWRPGMHWLRRYAISVVAWLAVTVASFALNAMIESERVTELGEAPQLVPTPSASGRGQQVARCPRCRVAVWSHYAGSGPFTKFVRVGTLDQPDLLPPDVHIFTASKQPWVRLPAGAPAFEEFYEREQVWSADSLARRAALLPLIQAWQAAQRR